MSDPFIGQIIQVGFSYAPDGWATCQGQQMAVSQNQALFSLLGNTFGGDGRTTFNLPNFQGRVAVGVGSGNPSSYVWGQMGGSEGVTMNVSQMPAHTHAATATAAGASTGKATLQEPANGSVLARSVDNVGGAVPLIYQPAGTATNVALGGAPTVTIGNTGGSQPLPVMQPFLAVYTLIALQGLYPSRP